jgi:hypothetical protein
MFYWVAKLYEFDDTTWVSRRKVVDSSIMSKYFLTVYWAFQTLTTVGYGDFGCGNIMEIIITILWMCIGVIFYTFTFASLISILVD